MVLRNMPRLELAAIFLGAIPRLLLILLATPFIYNKWFIPFLLHAATHPSLDPWSSFLLAGGDHLAFPYGPLYVVLFEPLVAIGNWLAGLHGSRLGLSATVLALDVALFMTLRSMAPDKKRPLVTYAYWLSPIVIYICYWHGQLDIVPVLALALSLKFIQDRAFLPAGVALGSAIAAKLSMGIAAPFIWIFSVGSRRIRSFVPALILGSILGVLPLIALSMSTGFTTMVLKTPETVRAFAISLKYGEGYAVYIFPLALAALVYLSWSIRRFNFETIFSMIGVAFFALFLFTPAPPGWALWLVPFITAHLTRTSRGGWYIAMAFSALYLIFQLSTATGAIVGGLDLSRPIDFASSLNVGDRARNLLLSVYLVMGGVLGARMLIEGVFKDQFYKFTRRPLMIGIAGDSGAGKDTLANALASCFGETSASLVSGDDYHLWDRHKPMWRALTHLNPKANNIRRFSDDVISLRNRRPVRAPHYDHAIGRMTKPRLIKDADVIIALGLHALYRRELVEALDVKIFLAMDEGLRRYFKVQRDVFVRGHTLEAVVSSMEKRWEDSRRYIRPQVANADIVFTLEAIHPDLESLPITRDATPSMRLRIEGPASSEFSSLTRTLLGIAGLSVTEDNYGEGRPCITLEGDPSAEDIASAFASLDHRIEDILAIAPVWTSGLTGVMQVVVLDQVGQKYSTWKI